MWKYKYNYEEHITDQIQRLLRSKSPTEKHACKPKSRSMQAGMGSGLLETRAGKEEQKCGSVDRRPPCPMQEGEDSFWMQTADVPSNRA